MTDDLNPDGQSSSVNISSIYQISIFYNRAAKVIVRLSVTVRPLKRPEINAPVIYNPV